MSGFTHALMSACELKNKVRGLVAAAVAVLCLVTLPLGAAVVSAQQPDHARPSTEEVAPGIAAEPSEHTTEEEHHSVWAGLLWPTVNFAILAGLLWYFFKEPFVGYLRARHDAIRKDLVEAAQIKATAASQLADLERKLAALPAEIEALRARGAQEVVAEEARIANQAAAERERLLEQTRREIDLQVRLAKRELVSHAADLSVQLASERVQREITPADQIRLADRYLDKVSTNAPAPRVN